MTTTSKQEPLRARPGRAAATLSLVLVWALSLAGSNAQAGRACEERPPEAAAIERGMALASRR